MRATDPRNRLSLRFWGVRGSCPSPGPATAGVGGNTSCVQVSVGDEHVILDGGTGLRALGNELSARGPVRASLLFSHVHWDHIQGVPFFAPIFRTDTRLAVYGAPEEGTIEAALIKQMTGPSFPVPFDQLPAALRFETVEPGEPFAVGRFRVRAAALNHPNGVLAYRLEAGGRSIVYATDTEHYAGQIDRSLVDLARNADVLIYDAQYTPDEYRGSCGCARIGWGHSTWVEGVRVARAAGVGQLILFHHDPSHDDAAVAEIEQLAAAELPGTIAAREGLAIDLELEAPRAPGRRASTVPPL
jgi:phosphoribosyl 1,2-cyclic phosphodiesterase